MRPARRRRRPRVALRARRSHRWSVLDVVEGEMELMAGDPGRAYDCCCQGPRGARGEPGPATDDGRWLLGGAPRHLPSGVTTRRRGCWTKTLEPGGVLDDFEPIAREGLVPREGSRQAWRLRRCGRADRVDGRACQSHRLAHAAARCRSRSRGSRRPRRPTRRAARSARAGVFACGGEGQRRCRRPRPRGACCDAHLETSPPRHKTRPSA